MKKACKAQIKNKVDSDKFKEKLQKCLDKKSAKHLKREEKAQAQADRQAMKQEINLLKQEKSWSQGKEFFSNWETGRISSKSTLAIRFLFFDYVLHLTDDF